MAKTALARRTRSHTLRRRFLPAVERLESRTVLSVCGVTCSLEDGVLQVEGTAADDSIALRYDAAGGLVKVVGANEELIGQFPLAAVESLRVNGLDGDDRIEIDGRLALSASVNGGEGEDVLAAGMTPTTHSHGTAAVARIRPANIEQLLVAPAAAALAALVPPLVQSPSADEVASAPAQLAIEHGTHAAGATQAALPVHADHAFGSGVPYLATLPASQAHGHATLISATAAAGVGAVLAAVHALESSTAESNGSVVTHHSSNTSAESTELTSKFAAKRCTAKYTSKEVNRDVTGERQCDCPEKAAAAAEASRRAAVDEALTAPSMLTGAQALVDCLPCQWSANVAAETAGGVCSLVLPLEEHASECPDRADVAHDENAGAFYQGLQLVGLTLLGTSLLAIPSRRKKSSATADDEFEPAADWLFGRLWGERLNR